ncbi:LysR family transcriptional regulator [Marinomonas algicola]|uniref:LysR substrate-binding domain-containing protein n=1 Tax=Marinomonas algicola TaxID=2773454 RepID=UPI00174962F5|nr:LysR family transcriptional regulator [Marinomonas algicola]
MESKHLIYLSVILDKGSITAAAEHFNMAQPTLTRAMATLEMQAGGPLFTRSRFGVTNTPLGEALARDGRAIIRQVNSAQEQISRHKLGIKQNLRIAFGSLLGMSTMSIIIEKLVKELPEISITATTLNPATAIEGLLDDQFDIILAPNSLARWSSNIHQELILKDRIGIFCGANHPLAHKKVIQIEDFKELDWLSLGISSTFEKQTEQMLTSYGINSTRTKVVFRNDAIILMRMLETGSYLAALPHFPTSIIKKEYAIREITMKGTVPIERDIYLMCRGSIKALPIYEAFNRIARQVFKTLSKEPLS